MSDRPRDSVSVDQQAEIERLESKARMVRDNIDAGMPPEQRAAAILAAPRSSNALCGNIDAVMTDVPPCSEPEGHYGSHQSDNANGGFFSWPNDMPSAYSTCAYCGEVDKHTKRCGVTRLGFGEMRIDPDTKRPVESRTSEAVVARSATSCKCGSHEVPSNIDGVNWYWSRHTRQACTLELPNERCWCGRLRSEHFDGHAQRPNEPNQEKNDAEASDVVISAQLRGTPADVLERGLGVVGKAPRLDRRSGVASVGEPRTNDAPPGNFDRTLVAICVSKACHAAAWPHAHAPRVDKATAKPIVVGSQVRARLSGVVEEIYPASSHLDGYAKVSWDDDRYWNNTLVEHLVAIDAPATDYPLVGLQHAWWIAHEVAENSPGAERKIGAHSVAGRIHDAITNAGGEVPDVDPRSANPTGKGPER